MVVEAGLAYRSGLLTISAAPSLDKHYYIRILAPSQALQIIYLKIVENVLDERIAMYYIVIMEITDNQKRLDEREAVKKIVHKAIKNGTLVRQPCEVCGSTTAIAAHHDDYSKPLNVRWLCRKHHAKHHGQLITEKRLQERVEYLATIKTCSVRVPTEHIVEIERLVLGTEITISGWIRMAIKAAIERARK